MSSVEKKSFQQNFRRAEVREFQADGPANEKTLFTKLVSFVRLRNVGCLLIEGFGESTGWLLQPPDVALM